MTIAEVRSTCKSLSNRLPAVLAKIPRDVLIVAILVLSSSLCFGLGYLAGLDAGRASEISVELTTAAPPLSATASVGQVVASKNGTKYYLPGCAAADRISDANKVWFSSTAAAEKAGYAPAANCAGL